MKFMFFEVFKLAKNEIHVFWVFLSLQKNEMNVFIYKGAFANKDFENKDYHF